MGRDYSERQLTELVGLLRRRWAPVHKFNLRNSSYLLLGVIIRMIAGQFHADYIRKYIFEPLGVKQARVCERRGAVTSNRVERLSHNDKGRILNKSGYRPHSRNRRTDVCHLSLNDLLAWKRRTNASV